MTPVRWTSAAYGELADCWIDADSDTRARLTVAVDEFERSVALEPHQLGEGRGSDWRIAIIDLLVFEFRPDELQPFVLVTHVRRVRHRRRS